MIVDCVDNSSEHQDFSESTEEIAPLTEEEKKQRLTDLRTALAEKRAKQALLDKEEAKKNEVRYLLPDALHRPLQDKLIYFDR